MLEVKYYSFCSLYQVALINLGHLKVVSLFLLQLPLMLVCQHSSAVDIINVRRLGASFHHHEHEHSKLEVLSCQYGNLISPVWCHPANYATRPSHYITDFGDVHIRKAD